MALPVAAIVCIVLACWALLILVLFAVYQLLKTRGSCNCECAPCGKADDTSSCTCCQTLSDSCNCCNPSVDGCLNSVCPSGKKKVSCIDLLLCQCTAAPGEQSCCLKIFCCCNCDCCQLDDCCSCCADCEGVVCCCLEIRLVSKTISQQSPAKYTVSSSTNDNSSRDIVTRKAQTVTQKKKKPLVESPSSSPPGTPTTSRSVRSVSQLVLTADSNLSKRKPLKTGAKKLKSKSMSSDTVRKKVDIAGKGSYSATKPQVIGDFELARISTKSRSLPIPPERGKKQVSKKNGASKVIIEQNSEYDNGSELVEVPVTRSDIPVHISTWAASPDRAQVTFMCLHLH